MLTIEIRINGRIIGFARATNLNGKPLSDYRVEAGSTASPVTGAPDLRTEFQVKKHFRAQSAWALVELIAARMASPAPVGMNDPHIGPVIDIERFGGDRHTGGLVGRNLSGVTATTEDRS